MLVDKMVLKVDKLSLSKLLSDTIPMLCKNSLPLSAAFRIEAMIGITFLDESNAEHCSDENVVLICFKQTMTDDGNCVQQSYGDSAQSSIDNATVGQSNDSRYAVSNPVTNGASSYDTAIDPSMCIKSEINLQDDYYSVSNRPIEIDDKEGMHGADDDYDEQRPYAAEDLEDYDNNAGQEGNEYYASASGESFSQQPLKKEIVNFEGDSYNNFANSEHNQHFDDQSWYQQNQVQSQEHFSQTLPERKFSLHQKGHNARSSAGVKKTWRRKIKYPLNASASGTNVLAGSLPSQHSTHKGGYSLIASADLCDSLLQQSSAEDNSYVCHVCSARLSSATSLRNHIRGTHLALKSVYCNVCGESFKWAMQVARHKKRVHDIDGLQLQVYQ